MTDPGPEVWARHHAQLTVINAMQRLIDDEPDRFTGMGTDTSARVTLYVIDPKVVDEPPLARLLADADRELIAVTIAPGVRPLRELNQIMDEIIRTHPFESLGAYGAGWWIDPPTGTVQIEVGASAADAVRAAFAHHGDAVVVTASPPADLTPREARGTPLMELVGQPVEPTAARLRDEGLDVEIHHLGHPIALTLDLRPNRVRLFVHDDLVRDASRG